MTGQTISEAPAVPLESEWKLPDRGTIGIIFLIITESSLFTIFVVAYLVYAGKSLSGPYPKDVL
jgi:cytochrome c oxidase subunit 3/cytochrome o ubiquinol oxidase subunit 3